jgi:peroxiredoxin Q/BCP
MNLSSLANLAALLLLSLAVPARAGLTDPFVGKKFPSVSLPSSTGGTGGLVKLPDDAKGHWALVYFYPKDDTPGCTVEANSYKERKAEFDKLGARVYGVSADDLESHGSFRAKNELNFPLLSDRDRRLGDALGVYGSGRGFASRDTFLIDPKGVIAEVWRKVNPSTTCADTLQAIRNHLRAPLHAN